MVFTVARLIKVLLQTIMVKINKTVDASTSMIIKRQQIIVLLVKVANKFVHAHSMKMLQTTITKDHELAAVTLPVNVSWPVLTLKLYTVVTA